MSPELAALAVHDLKNALGSLEGQLLALETDPNADAAGVARRLCQALRRDTVAFLTLYRDEGLRAMVDDESPAALLQAIVHHAQERDGPRVVLIGDGEAPPFWYFDLRLVRLALDAALHNACRFACATVWLSAHERDGWLVFRVDDDGPGLAAGSGASGDWSTGLGTELCRAVARAHRSGGREGRVVLADREQPAGSGARFELILP